MKSKILRNLSIIIFTFAIIIFINPQVNVLAESKDYFDPEQIISDVGLDNYLAVEAQKEALEAHNYLYDNYLVDSNGNDSYSAFYAGDYIENDKLVVMSTSEQELNIFKEMLSNYDCVIYKLVDFSYKHMEDYAENLMKQNDYFKSYTFLPKTNTLKMYTMPKDHPKATLLVNKIKKDYELHNYTASNPLSKNLSVVVSAIPTGTPSASTPLVGGDWISNGSSSFSLGFCGYYNGRPAIISSGHNLSVNDTLYHYSPSFTPIGQFTKVQFASGQYYDYSIAYVTNSNYSLTPKVYSGSYAYNQTSVNGIKDVPVGTLIYKYGASTNKVFVIEVTEKNSSVYYDTLLTVIYGMTRFRRVNNTDPIPLGDSGGPIYTMYGSTNKIYAVGVYSGYVGTDMYYTPIVKVSGFSTLYN